MTRRELLLALAAACSVAPFVAAAQLSVEQTATNAIRITDVILKNEKITVMHTQLKEPVKLMAGDSIDIHYTFTGKNKDA
jgi:hypothetical protein